MSPGMCQKVAGSRIVAILPFSAVYPIHISSFTREYSDRHSAADNFTVRDQICLNIEVCLCSARMNTESCNNLIKNQGDSQF